jgi:hypothetical protein
MLLKSGFQIDRCQENDDGLLRCSMQVDSGGRLCARLRRLKQNETCQAKTKTYIPGLNGVAASRI